MDYYDVLLGNPQDQGRLREMARQLRRQEAYGTLGAITGDPVLSQIGTGMVERAGQQAQGLRKAREAAEMMDFRRSEAERQGRQWEATARSLAPGVYQQGYGPIQTAPGYSPEERRAAEERKHGRALELTLAKQQAANAEFMAREDWKRRFIPEATWRGPKGVAQGLTQVEALAGLVGPMSQAKDLSAPAMDVLSAWATDWGLGGLARMTEPLYRSLNTRQLRSALENVLTRIRNSIFGAALTQYEGANYEKVSPLAPGLEKEAMIQRTKDMLEYLRKEANREIEGRLSPSGQSMPSWMAQGFKWEDSSGQKEEQPVVQGVDTGTRATLKLPEGWSIEED